MQVVETVAGMASVMESTTIHRFVSLVTQATWEKAAIKDALMAQLLSQLAGKRILVNVTVATLELIVVRNVMATANVKWVNVFVIAGGEELSVRQ